MWISKNFTYSAIFQRESRICTFSSLWISLIANKFHSRNGTVKFQSLHWKPDKIFILLFRNSFNFPGERSGREFSRRNFIKNNARKAKTKFAYPQTANFTNISHVIYNARIVAPMLQQCSLNTLPQKANHGSWRYPLSTGRSQKA